MKQLDDLDAVRAWLNTPDRPAAALQEINLSSVHDVLRQGAFPGCLFLSCQLPRDVAAHLVAGGATVIGPFPERLFSVHRASLYSADELFEGFDEANIDSRNDTLDHRIYEEFLDDGGAEPASIAVSLARRLHDHSITEAVDELAVGRKVVAFMGGHALERADPAYMAVALMSRSLVRQGVLVASGGGPGAMEATHLGAWFAGRPDADLQEALQGVFINRPTGAKPGKEYADPDWLHRAMALRNRYPQNAADCLRFASLGIPTWLYGHEPPAPFATHIAKYFANSVREDGLLALAKGGVVFAPGSAGTIQEIFQDLTQNHYGTVGVSSPMVLYNVDYWTRVNPVWPLLKHLAHGRRWGELVFLVNSPEEALEKLAAYEPLHYLSGDADRDFEARLRRALSLRANVRFMVQRESVPTTLRDLTDDDVLRQSVIALLERQQRRSALLLTEGVRASVASSVVLRSMDFGDWLLKGIGDDWVSPARLRDELPALTEGLTLWGLPGVDVRGLGFGGVPSPGIVVMARDGLISVWAYGLVD